MLSTCSLIRKSVIFGIDAGVSAGSHPLGLFRLTCEVSYSPDLYKIHTHL